MDDNAQSQPAGQPAAAPTQKQQITEILRSANNYVITTSNSPSIDDYSAAIALAQILEKLGKRAETVVSKSAPKELGFLPTNLLSSKFSGLRDFVMELDISKTEADKLKYIPEGKRLKIYITPYNGNFTKDDLAFSYGDYHCDAVLALGVSKSEDLDAAIANQKQLLAKTKLVLVNAGAKQGVGNLAWNEPAATSICEMLMSLTEALQPGLLDNHIATSLLTGIMASTDHFTATNTTPKVMTMAAQLMAAGASQAEIVQNLQAPGKGAPRPGNQPATAAQPGGSVQELTASGEQTLPHRPISTKNQPTPPLPPMPVMSPAPPPVAPMPPHSPLISEVRSEHDGNPFATVSGSPINTPPTTAEPVVNSTPSNSGLVSDNQQSVDLDSARKAVEEAANQVPTVPMPPMPGPVLPPQVPKPPAPGQVPPPPSTPPTA